MSEVIIAENLGKKYIISHQAEAQYTALRDVIADGAKRLIRRKNQKIPKREDFWALRNVSFKINQGERIGIIGKNGAGKTTLLKLLSRITEPSEGRIKIKGRVASLLEVGTGFHPELTGRENIYLNGAVLGMTRSEIKKKFDDIVIFSGVEKFLDTPVKRYSSGMYVRLAFAVAAHLEPEILLIDEVLAVGDAEFQKKCLGKMENISSKEGRTVLFVSHNMNAIEQLCNRCLLIKNGNLKIDSKDVRKVTSAYLFGEKLEKDSSEWINNGKNEYKNEWIVPTRFFITNSDSSKLSIPISNNNDIWLNIEIEIKEFDLALMIGYALYNEKNDLLYFSCYTDVEEKFWPNLDEGKYHFKTKIPKRFLNEGKYRVELIACLYKRFWIFEPGINCPTINIIIQGGLSDSPYWREKRPGILAPACEWIVKPITGINN